MTARYADRDEVFEAGDAFYTPSGHVPVQHEPGTEFVWFSPSDELRTAEAVMVKTCRRCRTAQRRRREGARGVLLGEEAVLHREHAWGGAGRGVDPCVVEVAAESLAKGSRVVVVGPFDRKAAARIASGDGQGQDRLHCAAHGLPPRHRGLQQR